MGWLSRRILTLWVTLFLGVVLGAPESLHSRSIAGGVALRILPLGDSITYGFGSSSGNGYRQNLRDKITGNTVAFVGSQSSGSMSNGLNEGHPGALISEIAQFATLSTRRLPNVVLLMAGTNDMNNPTDPSTAPTRLAALIDQVVAACPDAVVIVAKITPIRNGDANTRVIKYNNAIPAIVKTRVDAGKKVLVADLYSSLSVADLGDGLHPSDGGYQKIANVWYQAMEQAAANGWIKAPSQVPGGAGAGEVCEGYLYWDPIYGKVASGVASGDPSTFPKGAWQSRGTVHKGHNSKVHGYVHLADLDGDGKDDYLWVHPSTGAVTLYLNTGNFDSWTLVGQVASGIGAGAGVRFADMDGDGKADFLWISASGDVTYYLNGGRPGTGNWIWTPQGTIVSGYGEREVLRFADLDGDGRADLAVVGDNGSLQGYLNVGPNIKPKFRAMGQIASGNGAKDGVELRDVNGDGRADYLSVASNGAVTAFINMAGDVSGAAPFWVPIGTIASGIGQKRDNITFGDLNGDGKVDYLFVNYTSGALDMYQNAGSGSTYRAGDNIFLADIDGDGKDDYLVVSPGGAIEMYLNGGAADRQWIWYPGGQIAGGVTKRENIRFGDLDGDGKADYLVVDPDTSAVYFWQNGGKMANGEWLWIDKGKVAGGAGLGKGNGVRFADLDGDGKVDFIYLDSAGKATAYLNGGACAACENGWSWIGAGVVADGIGARREDVHFADINGDGKADYLWVDPIDGAVHMYRNGGPGTKWIWYPVDEPIASGIGSSGSAIRFADLNGDGRDEYLALSQVNGALRMWYNGCSGNPPPAKPDPPGTDDGQCQAADRMYSTAKMPDGEYFLAPLFDPKELPRESEYFITVVNLTPYMFRRGDFHSYQFDAFDFADVPSGKSRQHRVVYGGGVGEAEVDTNGEVTFRLEGTGKTFMIRGTTHIPDSYPHRTVFDLRGLGLGQREYENPAVTSGVTLVITGSEEYGYMSSLKFQPGNWMNSLYDTIGDRQLRHIVMPGSHDAGMTKISTHFSGGGLKANSQNQGLGMYDQLRVGSRWFDTRIGSNGDDFFFTAHVSDETKSVLIGASGASLTEMIDDVNKFTAENPGEIIIWWIKYMVRIDHGQKRTWSVDTTKKFYKELEKLTNRCPGLDKSTSKLDKQTAKTFMDKNNGNGCVLLFTDGRLSADSPNSDVGAGIYHGPTWFDRVDFWAEQEEPEPNGNSQVAKMLTNPRDLSSNDNFLIMQWQCTPNTVDAAMWGLDAYATKASNPALYWHGVNAMSPEKYPTIILQDYIGQIHSSGYIEEDLTSFPDKLGAEIQTLVIGLNLYMASQNCQVAHKKHPMLKSRVNRQRRNVLEISGGGNINAKRTTTSSEDTEVFTSVIYANGTIDNHPPPGFSLGRVKTLKAGTLFSNGTVLTADTPNPDYNLFV